MMLSIPIIPALILLGGLYWPVTLGIGLLLAGVGALVRGGWRVALWVVAALFIADASLGLLPSG